jgi:hypothetical protein
VFLAIVCLTPLFSNKNCFIFLIMDTNIRSNEFIN